MSNSFLPLSPKVVLGVGAHPDDLDVTAGGTLAQFAKQGAEIHYLILTDGGKGSDDPNMTTERLIATRHAEQKAALDILGGASITFLDYPDGELEVTMELKKQIVKAIRTVKPDIVIAMDPTVFYSKDTGNINHPDHRAAGQATLDAVFPLARDRLSFPELIHEHQPHKTPILLLANFNEGNFVIDIADAYDTKVAMMRTHESQFKADDFSWLRELAKEQAEDSDFELGERFVRLDIR